MSKIISIQKDIFFAKEYNDGIIVAFKSIGDNSSSYANKIHQIVVKNLGADILVSDVIESISAIDSHKNIIGESLYIYIDNRISISASGILSNLNQDVIEIEYNSKNVLTIKEKRLGKPWWLCFFVLLCVCGYSIIFDEDQPIKPHNELSLESQKGIAPDFRPNIILAYEEEEYPIQVEDSIICGSIFITTEQSDKHVETPTSLQSHKLEHSHTVEANTQRDNGDTGRERQGNALKAEAKEYLRIADQAYVAYVENFDESKGAVALTNYRKALNLAKKHRLFFSSEMEKIEQSINALEKELK